MSLVHDLIDQRERDDLAHAVKGTAKPSRKIPRIDRLRKIVAEHQATRTEGVFMDATTANMLVRVHDALNEENRAKFLALPIRKMVAVGWKLVK